MIRGLTVILPVLALASPSVGEAPSILEVANGAPSVVALPPGVDAGRTDVAKPLTAVESLDHSRLAGLLVGERVEVGGLRLGAGVVVNLDLERFDVVTNDALLVVAGVDGERVLPAPHLVLLRGPVIGEADSLAFLGVSPYGVHGFVRRAGSLHIISTGRYAERIGADFALQVTDAATMPAGQPFCGTEAHVTDLMPSGPPSEGEPGAEGRVPPCRIARVALDTDFEFTATLFGGDIHAAAAYALTLLAAISEIYADDLRARLLVSYLRVWEIDRDPYYGSDMHEALDQLRAYWRILMDDVEREIAHLLSGRNLGGGVAYVGVVCNGSWGYGVSSLNGSFPYPLEDHLHGNWDVFVVAHEIGHNFGTLHTHDGYEPPIDGCGTGDCSGADEGTIMSYCHICSGGLSNINLNFHPLVISTILDYLGGNSCDITAEGVSPVDDHSFTYEDDPAIVDVLMNDETASCDEVLLAGFDATSVSGGSVELIPAGEEFPRDLLRYTPPAGFSGSDSFSYVLTAGSSATAYLEVAPLHDPPVTGPIEPGVAVKYYILQSPYMLPDFDALTPYAADVVAEINFSSTDGEFATGGRADQVGAVLTGFVTVPADGVYTFYTNSDDGSGLYIGDQQVVHNEGRHPMEERAGLIGLRAGAHAIRVEFFENFGGAGLITSFEGPTLPKQSIPASAWSHRVPGSGDFNDDGDVDLTDFLTFSGCLNGPNVTTPPAGCEPEAFVEADLDLDNDVDLADFTVFVLAFELP